MKSSLAERYRHIKDGINLLTPVYDFLTVLVFGKLLFRSQKYFMPELGKFRSVLIIGGGSGTILLELLKYDIADQYYFLDLSDHMVKKAMLKTKREFPDLFSKVTFKTGSQDDIEESDEFDLIVTPYVLDFFSDDSLSEIMPVLNGKLQTGGKWLFCDFEIPSRPLLWRIFSWGLVVSMYLFFNLFCSLGIYRLADFKKQFEAIGLQQEAEKYFLQGLVVSRVYRK